MSDEVIEMQKKANELLENKGLTVGERLMVKGMVLVQIVYIAILFAEIGITYSIMFSQV